MNVCQYKPEICQETTSKSARKRGKKSLITCKHVNADRPRWAERFQVQVRVIEVTVLVTHSLFLATLFALAVKASHPMKLGPLFHTPWARYSYCEASSYLLSLSLLGNFVLTVKLTSLQAKIKWRYRVFIFLFYLHKNDHRKLFPCIFGRQQFRIQYDHDLRRSQCASVPNPQDKESILILIIY